MQGRAEYKPTAPAVYISYIHAALVRILLECTIDYRQANRKNDFIFGEKLVYLFIHKTHRVIPESVQLLVQRDASRLRHGVRI